MWIRDIITDQRQIVVFTHRVVLLFGVVMAVPVADGVALARIGSLFGGGRSVTVREHSGVARHD